MMLPILKHFVDNKICQKLATSAHSYLSAHHDEFWLEIAAMIDALLPFASACYFMESDDMIGPYVFDKIVALKTHTDAVVFTKVASVIQSCVAALDADTRASRSHALVEMAKNVVDPAILYFRSKFINDDAPLRQAMSFFEAIRIFDPSRIVDIPVPKVIEYIKRLPFVTPQDEKEMVEGRAEYVSLAAAAPDLVSYWRLKQARLPTWSRIAFTAGLVLPSSGCVERVFSLLRNLFNDRQESLLEDYIENSVRSSYNRSQRAHLPPHLRILDLI